MPDQKIRKTGSIVLPVIAVLALAVLLVTVSRTEDISVTGTRKRRALPIPYTIPLATLPNGAVVEIPRN